jgi:hypothetical protein
VPTVTNIGPQLPGEVIDTFYAPVSDIYSDEPATWLREFNSPTADGQGRNRYQEIHVLRDTHVGTWFYNLGPTWKFTAQEFQVVGGTVRSHKQDIETVESIRDCAEWLRDEGGLRKVIDPAALMVTQENFLNAVDNRRDARRHKSVSGRYMKVER